MQVRIFIPTYTDGDAKTTDKDLYNHSGKVFLAGLKYDRPVDLFGNEPQLLLNGGVRSDYDTDDLHPDNKDNFSWADLKAAVVFEQMGDYIVPVLELTDLGEFGDYDELLLKPEVIIPFCDNASIELGGIISLSNDGNQGGFAGSLSYGF
ncbi:MAG: hypothetical protein ACI8Z5_001685 [Lentimonas sp.]|jgi:hypothetical protein